MPESALLAVWPVVATRVTEAEQLAQQLAVPVLPVDADETLCKKFTFLLVFSVDALSLLQGRQRIVVDFAAGASHHRRLHGGGRGQAVAKAVGLKVGNIVPTVLDATAGLGGDSFVLASLGCTVQMCERSALVHALLQDGIARASCQTKDETLQQIAMRMSLMAIDAKSYLTDLLSDPSMSLRPDVVYLDPMFPEKRKTAAVKKEMAAFHQLLGGDDDADALLPLALQVAQCRVVVKRPRHAPYLAHEKPGLILEGESTRFDIYPLRTMKLDV